MAVLRNALTTLAVTALLIGSLVFLFPTAAAVTITQVTVGPAAVTAGGSNDVISATAVVNIPAGEHIPLDVAKLYGVKGGTTHSGSLVTGDTLGCSATTTIVSITSSLSRVKATIGGNGYSDTAISNKGYGYGFEYGYAYTHTASKDVTFPSSNGYGYGYDQTGGYIGGTASVTVKATGCTIEEIVAAGVPTVNYEVQLLVGDGTNMIASLPATAAFKNSGCTTGCNAIVADNGGVSFVGTGLSKDTSSGEIAITGIDGVSSVEITPTSAGGLPADSKIVIAPATPDNNNPGFGVTKAALTAAGVSTDLARHIQVKIVDQDDNDLTGSSTFQLKLKFTIPQSYFAANPTLSSSSVYAYPFFDNGASKGGSIATTYNGCNSPCTTHSYTLTLTSFSSYPIAATSSGGGGGGGSPTTPPATPPTDSDNDGLPDSWEIANFGDITTTTGGADDDGDGLSNAQEYSAGTNPLSRDSDGDGISDGDEVAQGTDPTDPKDPLPPGSTDPGTTPSEPSEPATPGKKDGSRTPGFELVALVGALGAALVFARRRS